MNFIKIFYFISILIFINGCIKKEEEVKPPIVIHQPQPTCTVSVVNQDTPKPVITDNSHVNPTPPSIGRPIFSMDSISSQYLQGAYANNYKLKSFIEKMVTKHQFRREYLYGVFSTVNRDVKSLKKYNVYGKPKKKHKASSIGSWDKYPRFVSVDRVSNGVNFWRNNRYWLEKAAYVYGVAPEYIVGIIGVETNYGRDKGKHRLLDALTSLSLEYKKRSKFFTKQLEEYLLLTREQRLNPLDMLGSYGGAFGIVQFMPDSFRDYAVDFDENGVKDLFTTADAIGSTANFFVKKGKWNSSIPVAMRVQYPKKRFYGLSTGYRTEYSQKHLISLGMRPTSNFYGYKGSVSLIKLSKYSRDELWWGTKNFYAIGRYNPRDYYIMSVHQLAQAVRRAYYRR
jgi:membrane-bound lytic murein transglycosylase B